MQQLYSKPFSKIVSLGADCRVRYQISLSLYKRASNDAIDLRAFESALYASSRETTSEGTHFFDWNISPLSGVVTCIQNDFAGIFERPNLSIADNGSARDDATGILHHHNFSRVDGRVTQEIIDREYDTQRPKVEYLAGKFLDNLRKANGPTLYVRFGGGANEALQLVDAIERKHPGHEFHVLIVRGEEGDSAFEAADPRVTVYRMNKQIDKPAAAHWQGDNAKWGALLDPIRLVS